LKKVSGKKERDAQEEENARVAKASHQQDEVSEDQVPKDVLAEGEEEDVIF